MMAKAPTVHFDADRNFQAADGPAQYTACGAAAHEARYSCTGDPAKITCKLCARKAARKAKEQA